MDRPRSVRRPAAAGQCGRVLCMCSIASVNSGNKYDILCEVPLIEVRFGSFGEGGDVLKHKKQADFACFLCLIITFFTTFLYIGRVPMRERTVHLQWFFIP